MGSPRPNVNRKLIDEKIEQVLRTTLETTRIDPLEHSEDGETRLTSAVHQCRGYSER
jgi:hypothetical protein